MFWNRNGEIGSSTAEQFLCQGYHALPLTTAFHLCKVTQEALG